MSKKVFNMEGGLHSAAAYAAFENRLYGSVRATPSSFVVSAGSGLNASISSGDGLIDTGADFARRIQSTATETVAVGAGHASYNRIDSVVAYIDNSVTPDDSIVDNTNGILKFAVVAGTAAASPTAPSGATIQSAIGSGNPYLVLCNITVPQNAVNLSGATFANIAPTPLLKMYPIGAIYESVDSTDPANLFGGTWSAFGAGRVLVGRDAGQTEFDTVEETGGAKTHTLTTTEIPAHSHPVNYGGAVAVNNGSQVGVRVDGANNTSNTGGGGAHNNLQPYIVVYRWKRTA